MLSSLLGRTKPTDAVKASTSSAAPTLIESKSPPEVTKVNREQLEAALKAPAAIPPQAIYQGDPDDQVIVIDGDETLWDDFDKHKPDEAKIKALGRTIEVIPADHPENKLGKEIKYVLRPGDEELLREAKARGKKIIISTRNYEELAESIVATNPILKKYVDGVLGRSDLTCALNKNFTKFSKHPDNIGFGQKVLNFAYKYLWWYPTYPFRALYSFAIGARLPRLPTLTGELGKHPPSMNDMFEAEGNKNFVGCKPARTLIDNKVEYETDDPADTTKFQYSTKSKDFTNSAKSDFAVISPNVVRNPGDKKATHFFAEFDEPKIKVKDPTTGNEKEVYLWVKNVMECLERGCKAQYKLEHGKELIIADEAKKQ